MPFSQCKLKKEFYLQDAISLAKKLLGKSFVFNSPDGIMEAVIVETEAYIGELDEAAHSFKGKTKRTEIMFNDGGFLYVYLIYGMYYCLNVVAGFKGKGEAVLIRAMQPVKGMDIMAMNRYGKKDLTAKEKIELLSGPGKICKSFGITKIENGTDLTGNLIYLMNTGYNPEEIETTNRIGIKKAVDLPFRFYIKKNNFISKK